MPEQRGSESTEAREPKRQRLEDADVFHSLLKAGGVVNLVPGSSDTGEVEALQVKDAHILRSHLASKLLFNKELLKEFLQSLESCLQDAGALHRALLPMEVLADNCALGDSLLRVLLNVTPIQGPLCQLLLETLPVFGASTEPQDATIARLMLGQLRWLEVVVNSATLVSKALEVMAVCSPEIQRDLVGFLPEVANEGDHAVLVEQYLNLLDADLSMMQPILDAIGCMDLRPELKEKVVQELTSRLYGVELDDLPALVTFLLQSSDAATAQQVMETLRDKFHFVSPTDPRLQVPDLKGKGKVKMGRVEPEKLVMEAIAAGLQRSDESCDAFLKAFTSISESNELKVIDYFLMLMLHGRNSKSQAAVERVFCKKIQDGIINQHWLTKCMSNHEAALKPHWPALINLAQMCAQKKSTDCSRIGAHIYSMMFAHVDHAFNRQEVLQALHGHLGSRQSDEVDTALQALSTLSAHHQPLLAQFGSFLTNILDYLDTFSDAQLRKVFRIFLQVSPPSLEQQGEHAPQLTSSSRLGNQLMITIDKALNHADPAYKRIGIIGTTTLLCQLVPRRSELNLPTQMPDGVTPTQLVREQDPETAMAVDRWCERVNSAFRACSTSPACKAFLLDEIALLVDSSDFDQAHPGCLGYLSEKVASYVEAVFIQDIPKTEQGMVRAEDLPKLQIAGAEYQSQLVLNLDGHGSDIYIPLATFTASRDVQFRQTLLWLCPVFRALTKIMWRIDGDLSNVDALLGCPIQLPPIALYQDASSFTALPRACKEVVFSSLMFTSSWLRELLNGFSCLLSSPGPSLAVDVQRKVMMRLTQLAQLEAIIQELLPLLPPAFVLPHIAQPLGTARAVVGGERPGEAGKTTQIKPDVLKSQLRGLHIDSLVALVVEPAGAAPGSLLAPVCFLAADIAAKVSALLKPAKALPWATQQAAGPPPDLVGVTLEQLLTVVGGLIPAWRRHLEQACLLLKQGEGAPEPEVPPFGLTEEERTDEGFSVVPWAEQASNAAMAAHRLALVTLDCFASILSQPACLPPKFLYEMLKALSPLEELLDGPATNSTAAATPTLEQVIQAAQACFRQLEVLSTRETPRASFYLELSLLRAMAAITTAVSYLMGQMPESEENVRGANAVSEMRAQLSSTAQSMLQHKWGPPEAEYQLAVEPVSQPFTWKGQGGIITELLGIMINCSPRPSETLLQLAQDVLQEMPAKVAAKLALQPVAEYSAFCFATFTVWYKVCLERLEHLWSKICLQMQQCAKSKEIPGSEQLEVMLKDFENYIAVFNNLVEQTKKHRNKTGVLGWAVKAGGLYASSWQKTLPFWRLIFETHRQTFFENVRVSQKGTRTVQTICAEGKTRQANAVAAKVPAAKRSLESLVFAVKSFFHEMRLEEAFILGNLKHKDLAGQAVSSQMYPSQMQDDEGSEEEEEYDNEGEEQGEEGNAASGDEAAPMEETGEEEQ